MAKRTRRTGQGTVYQRKDGRWEGAITHGYSEAGNPKRYRVIKQTRADAVAALNQIIMDMNLGVPVTETSQTASQFLEFWLEQEVRPSKAPKTVRFYEQMTRLYIEPSIGHLSLKEITPQHVQTLLNKMAKKGLSPSTIHHVKTTLTVALNTAVKWSLLRQNAATRANAPKIERKDPVFLSLPEAKALLVATSEHYLSRLIELALLTGPRIGEATGLRWEDVNFDLGVIQIRTQLQRVDGTLILRGLKSNSSRRTLALSANAIECLKGQRANQLLWQTHQVEGQPFNKLGLCFTGMDGRPLDPRTVDNNLKKFAKKAGVEKQISFHKLRHTVATHLAASGIPLSVLKEQLGHSQISLTVNTYSHAVPTALRQAADRLDDLLAG